MEALAALLAEKAPGLRVTAGHLAGWRPPTGGRIKVAFVSMLLSDHTIGQLYQGMIAGLDRGRFEVVVAHLPRSVRDPVRAQISASADLAIDLPPGVAAQRQRLEAERLDVVFYPDVGMSPESYLLAQARLAPVQAVSWGHPDTTGLPSLDYFVSGDAIEPEGAETAYTERLIRLPRLPCVYRPLGEAEILSREALGLPAAGALYGCPQSLFKLHPDFDPVLAEIVDRDPRGWLVFVEGQRPTDREALESRWAARFPALKARARFVPRAARAKFLGLLAAMDVLLDPPHFGSGNTFYEAARPGRAGGDVARRPSCAGGSWRGATARSAWKIRPSPGGSKTTPGSRCRSRATADGGTGSGASCAPSPPQSFSTTAARWPPSRPSWRPRLRRPDAAGPCRAAGARPPDRPQGCCRVPELLDAPASRDRANSNPWEGAATVTPHHGSTGSDSEP